MLQRLGELQSNCDSLERHWRERAALFGAVSTVPISAVAALPLRGDQHDTAMGWAEFAGMRLPRSNMRTSVSGSSLAAMAKGLDGFARRSSRGVSATCTAVLGSSAGVGGPAFHTTSGSNHATTTSQQLRHCHTGSHAFQDLSNHTAAGHAAGPQHQQLAQQMALQQQQQQQSGHTLGLRAALEPF